MSKILIVISFLFIKSILSYDIREEFYRRQKLRDTLRYPVGPARTRDVINFDNGKYKREPCSFGGMNGRPGSGCYRKREIKPFRKFMTKFVLLIQKKLTVCLFRSS